MKFTDRSPSTWFELQDYVSLFLNQAGYISTSPCTIETARGKVDVDVFVESPDELIKKIICECKFWNTPVTKEKVHAFRTVVYDTGASLGLLISKSGFQSGAIEASKYSNVKLMRWDEFTELISDKWILTQLKKIKKKAAPLAIITDPLDLPYEKLKENDLNLYYAVLPKYIKLWGTCWMLSKTDLINDNYSCNYGEFYRIKDFSSIESYLNSITAEVDTALETFDTILNNSDIEIPEEKLECMNSMLYMYLD